MAIHRMPALPPKLKPPPPIAQFESLGSDAEIGFQVSDATPLIETLLSLPKVALDAAGYEMSHLAEEVIIDSKDNYVPVDTGNLKDSGDWDEYKPDTNQTLAQIGMWYAGNITAEQAAHGLNMNAKLYALEQHENTLLHHPGGGEAKYLEKPFNNKKPEIAERIAAAIRSALGGGLLTWVVGGPNGPSNAKDWM